MKFLLSLIAFGTLVGCSLPSKTFHSAAAVVHRSSALSREEIQDHVKVTDQQSELLSATAHESVVVIARNAQEVSTGRAQPWVPSQARIPQTGISVPSGNAQGEINAQERALAETIMIKGLLQKGYRGASRLNLPVFEVEKIFPAGRVDTDALRAYFRGSLLLLFTITRIENQPELYSWNKFFSGEKVSRNIGTRLEMNVSLELISLASSETIFITTAEFNEVIRDDSVSRSTLIEDLVKKSVERLPRRNLSLNQRTTTER